MNTWKIRNVYKESVKLIIQTAAKNSAAIILKPDEFVVCSPKKTPAMDAQMRRQVIEVDNSFDNTLYGFDMGKAYPNSELEAKKMLIAETKAMQYINKEK